MFAGFEEKNDPADRRRIFVSTTASAFVYLFIGIVIVGIAKDPETLAAVKEISVVLQAPLPEMKPTSPPESKPAVPETMKVKRVRALRAPEPLREIKEIPEEKPAEANPTHDEVEVAEAGGSASDGSAGPNLQAPPSPPPKAAPRVRPPINLPESATPPVPHASNRAPEFPELARVKGLEGQVILKVVISENGEVLKIEVLRGEEPFTEAAILAVRAWRYSPALIDGQAISVFRIIKIPFKLKV